MLIRGKNLTLIDFGMSRMVTPSPSNDFYTSCVTTYWQRAPELFSATSATSKYDPTAVDNWSMGIIITDILGGINWIKCSSSEEQKSRFKALDVERIINYLTQFYKIRWFKEADALLRGLLCTKPSERMTSIEACALLHINISRISCYPSLYPLAKKSTAYLSIRKKYLEKILILTRKYCAHRSTFSIACSILDAYQETSYDVEWLFVSGASLILAVKLMEYFEVQEAIISEIQEFNSQIQQKERTILKELNNVLFYEIVDHSLICDDEKQDIKETILVSNCELSMAQMVEKIEQTYKLL